MQLLLLLRNGLQYNLVRLLLLHGCAWLIKCDATLGCVLRTRMVYPRHGVLQSSTVAPLGMTEGYDTVQLVTGGSARNRNTLDKCLQAPVAAAGRWVGEEEGREVMR
jgi:hypothetical protein